VKLVLDAGALVAIERRDRRMWGRLRNALDDGLPVVTHGGVIGQVWRAGGARQALLARALPLIRVHALDETAGRAAGALLAETGGRDVIDAALVLLAEDDDQIFTSDARAADVHVELVPV
jgi:predicted kinase